MNKLTAEIARMDIGHLREHQANPHVGLSLREEKYLQALEIALPVLEQPEGDGDVFIVMRNPGKVPDIKRPVGDVADYLLQLYRHNPDAVCDVVTYRFAGVSGQWVQDGRELLAMAGVALEQHEKGDDGWIDWKGNGPTIAILGKTVEVRFQDNDTDAGPSRHFYWGSNCGNRIIAYRVIDNDGREG